MACKGCKHKSAAKSGGIPIVAVDMSNWVEVIPVREGKIVVPEWMTVRVHAGEPIRLPPTIVAKNRDFFTIAPDKYVDQILGDKSTKSRIKEE